MSNKTTTTTNKFPEKPITMIVGFPAGGGADFLARAMEKVAPKYLGQPLVVINKPGGAGTLGWNELAGSISDGYTLSITTPELILLPLYEQTRYHYLTALNPISQISNSSFIMIVRSDQPWQNLHELIEYAKKYPGKLKFGHSGIGSMSHVIGETFAKEADINIKQVPFRGTSETIAALLGGHIDIAFVNAVTPKEYIKNGTIKAFAVPAKNRLLDSDLLNIPTFQEQGFNIVFNNWYGIAAPKDLPPIVEAKLEEGFKMMVLDPEFKKDMNVLGLEIDYLGSQDFQDKWIEDNKKLTKSIQETGILDLIKGQKK